MFSLQTTGTRGGVTILLLFDLMLAGCRSQPPGRVTYPAVIDPIEGRVGLQIAGETEWGAVSEQTFLNQGDTVMTGEAGRAALFVRDGSRMLLGPNTVVTLKRFAHDEDYRVAKLYILKGMVIYNIASPGGKLSIFQFMASGATLTVIGTTGEFEYDAGSQIASSALLDGTAIFGGVTQDDEGGPAYLLQEQTAGSLIATNASNLTPEETVALTELVGILGIGGPEAIAALEETGDVNAGLDVVEARLEAASAGWGDSDVGSIHDALFGDTSFTADYSQGEDDEIREFAINWMESYWEMLAGRKRWEVPPMPISSLDIDPATLMGLSGPGNFTGPEVIPNLPTVLPTPMP